MEQQCDSRAVFKHHLTKKHLAFLKQYVMDMCRRKNLHQADLLARAGNKVTDKEYRFTQRKQKKRKATLDRSCITATVQVPDTETVTAGYHP